MIAPVFVGVKMQCQPFSPMNRGNFLHAVAARRLVGGGREMRTTQPWTDAEIESLGAHSHVVLVMANAIRLGAKEARTAWHRVTADNIERTDLPTVVFGLGAQAQMEREARREMPADTLRLLKVLSERSKRIAVRGPFTAEVLNDFGIKNADPIGCQSTFWHGERFPFALNSDGPAERVAFNYTTPRMEARFVEWAVDQGLTMIGQSEMWEEHAKAGIDYDGEQKKYGRLFADSDLTRERYAQYCKAHFHAFTNVDDWMDFLKDYDFSFGSRFHGNMTAVQSGVPALWLVHDSRTKELCELLHLPHMMLADAMAAPDVERFRKEADYSDFLSHYPAKFKRFKDYVEEAGLALAV